MKPRDCQPRSLNISSSRWMAYAVAGVATAAGGVMSAEGAIHYSGMLNVRLSGSQRGTRATFQLDRPGDSIFFQHFQELDSAYDQANFGVSGIYSQKFAGSDFAPSVDRRPGSRRSLEGFDQHLASRLPRGEYVSQAHLTEDSFGATLAPGRFDAQGLAISVSNSTGAAELN